MYITKNKSFTETYEQFIKPLHRFVSNYRRGCDLIKLEKDIDYFIDNFGINCDFIDPMLNLETLLTFFIGDPAIISLLLSRGISIIIKKNDHDMVESCLSKLFEKYNKFFFKNEISNEQMDELVDIKDSILLILKERYYVFSGRMEPFKLFYEYSTNIVSFFLWLYCETIYTKTIVNKILFEILKEIIVRSTRATLNACGIKRYCLDLKTVCLINLSFDEFNRNIEDFYLLDIKFTIIIDFNNAIIFRDRPVRTSEELNKLDNKLQFEYDVNCMNYTLIKECMGTSC